LRALQITEAIPIFHGTEVYLHSVDHETKLVDNTEIARVYGTRRLLYSPHATWHYIRR
jgi:hypothetical protein